MQSVPHQPALTSACLNNVILPIINEMVIPIIGISFIVFSTGESTTTFYLSPSFGDSKVGFTILVS